MSLPQHPLALLSPARDVDIAKEAIAAVASCRHAGIRVKMITGDHAITARAVALQIGLADEGGQQGVVGCAQMNGGQARGRGAGGATLTPATSSMMSFLPFTRSLTV